MNGLSRTAIGPLLVLMTASLNAWGPSAHAQTTLNPDISLIGDVRASGHNDGAAEDADQLNLDLEEAELAVQGYLNPYVRADVFLAWHGTGESEIEELYATFLRGLPLGLSVRAGQYLLDFGKVNPLHPHAYSFINRPLAHEEFFGEEGLRDVGVSASIPIPTGNVATTLSADMLRGDFLQPHEHGDEHAEEAMRVRSLQEEHEEDERPNERAFAARLNSFVALDEYTSLSLGVTGLTGIPHEDQRRWVGGADVKLRWKPDRYRSCTVVGEWLVNRQPAEEHHDEEEIDTLSALRAQQSSSLQEEEVSGDITSHGLFGYFDYQFRQRFNVGAQGSWAQALENNDATGWELGMFAGFAPAEETTLLRALISYGEPIGSDEAIWAGTLQLIFSLGPHKPHIF
jgi:hypothetical protein